MAAIRQPFQGGTNKKDTESHWQSTMLAKRKSCFSIASLLKDTTIQLRELSGLNADGPQKPRRQRPEFAVALKQCFKMQNAHLVETRQSLRPIRPEHQQRQREDHDSKEEKTSITMSIGNWMAVLQRATGKPAGSVFIFNIAVAKLTMADELELMVFHII